MNQIWTASTFGFNLVPTLLLGLVVLYWILSIVGALNHECFDLDLDVGDIDTNLDTEAGGAVDGGVAGPFHGILVFLNLGEVPLMLFLSLTFLFAWIIAVATKLALPLGFGMTGVMLIPNVVVSLLLTKAVTSPFRNALGSMKNSDSGIKVLGQTCTLLTNLQGTALGQAEIVTKGAPVRINVRAREGSIFRKGQSAIVLEMDAQRKFYILSPFNE